MANCYARTTGRRTNGWRSKPVYANDDGELIPTERNAGHEPSAATTDDVKHADEYAELAKYDVNDEQLKPISGETKIK